jgi:Zn-dependent M28 family amino/carboxypeptidase
MHSTLVRSWLGVSRQLTGRRDATVNNVVARMPGTSNGKATMLVAHYDSALIILGASNDGEASQQFLETLRALKASDSLKNDVIRLFTDGEEEGLLGSTAFLDENSWIKDVGLLLNFFNL